MTRKKKKMGKKRKKHIYLYLTVCICVYSGQDYYTKMFGRPMPELNQDFTLLNATEQNQITSLAFSRKRNTSDPEDVAIQVNCQVQTV